MPSFIAVPRYAVITTNRATDMRSILLLLPLIFLAGCKTISVSDISNDIGKGLVDGLADREEVLRALVDSVLTTAGESGNRQAVLLRDSLLGERTRALLAALEQDFGNNLTATSVSLRDSLIGPYTRAWLLNLERDLTTDLVLAVAGIRENLLGEKTRANVARLREEILGAQTALFVAGLRDTLLGPKMRAQLALLRDDLLGPETERRIDSILTGVTDHLQRVTKEEEGFLKKNITEILWTVGGIIALLLILGAVIMARERRYKKMLELLTFQIHEIPNRQAYDELTTRIQREAQKEGIEPKLREFLSGQGILGTESWRG